MSEIVNTNNTPRDGQIGVNTQNKPVDEQDYNVGTNGTQSDVQPTSDDSEYVTKHYAVNPLMHHVSKGATVKYFVRWSGYTPANDTINPPKGIFKHFITRCWCRVRKKGSWRFRLRQIQRHKNLKKEKKYRKKERKRSSESCQSEISGSINYLKHCAKGNDNIRLAVVRFSITWNVVQRRWRYTTDSTDTRDYTERRAKARTIHAWQHQRLLLQEASCKGNHDIR